MKKKIALVLGGVINHCILIEKLKKRGYYTILIDYLDDPPAKHVADEHVQISTFDVEGIKKVAIERGADLIINACLDQVNEGICKIAEELNLPHPYSYETALDVADKERMKIKMRQGGIPTTSFVCVTSPDELDGMSLNFPVYIKPADMSGSNGVSRVKTFDEAKKAVQKALDMSRDKRCIVEEEAPGNEYNVYCFPQNGKGNVLMVVRRYSDNDSEDGVVKSVATLTPPLLSDKMYNKIGQVADSIASVFGLDNVPMFFQAMIKGDQINVIEFAGRMAGGFSHRTILENTGFDLFEATINSFLRIPNIMNNKQPEYYLSVSSMYSETCVLDRYDGYQTLLDDGTIFDIQLSRQPGTEIKEGRANGNKIGFIINKSDNIDDLLEKIERSFQAVNVYGTDGKQHLKKRFYLTKEMLQEEDEK